MDKRKFCFMYYISIMKFKNMFYILLLNVSQRVKLNYIGNQNR